MASTGLSQPFRKLAASTRPQAPDDPLLSQATDTSRARSTRVHNAFDLG